MSRIGKQLINIPESVKVEIDGQKVKASGPLGELSLELPEVIQIEINGAEANLGRKNDEKISRSLHGLYRVLVLNLITGVSEGFKKSLEFKGIGYRVVVNEDTLTINAGYSHPVDLKIPESLKVIVQKSTITVNGIDKYLVGEFAAKIRQVRPPEVYKGKGIRYSDEQIHIKPGKTAAKG